MDVIHIGCKVLRIKESSGTKVKSAELFRFPNAPCSDCSEATAFGTPFADTGENRADVGSSDNGNVRPRSFIFSQSFLTVHSHERSPTRPTFPRDRFARSRWPVDLVRLHVIGNRKSSAPVATAREKRFHFKFSWKRSIRPGVIAVNGIAWPTPAATLHRDGRFSLGLSYIIATSPGRDCLRTMATSSRTIDSQMN